MNVHLSDHKFDNMIIIYYVHMINRFNLLTFQCNIAICSM